MSTKEKIEDILYYLVMTILVVVVFYAGYYAGPYIINRGSDDIPIGQEYQLKDVIQGPNSTFTIVYYDNDENKTEKYMVPTVYNTFNFTQSNVTTPFLKLEKIENGVKYWNVYVP